MKKIQGLFLNERLSSDEKNNLYDSCIGCLNRICVTDNREEVLTMLASLQVKAMILGKDTFMRIAEKEQSSIKEYDTKEYAKLHPEWSDKIKRLADREED